MPGAGRQVWMRRHCGPAGSPQSDFHKLALFFGFTRVAHHGDLTRAGLLPALYQDLATFLLVRGAYGWLGAGWAGCNAYPTYYAPFEQDYGVPVDSTYSETRHKSGVFVRNWTKARVSFDCNSYKGTIAAI